MVPMLLSEVARVSAEVAATAGRRAKVARLAACLRQAADFGDSETVATVVCFLQGEPRQRRTGLGWVAVHRVAAMGSSDQDPVGVPLSVAEVDTAFASAAALSGPGSAGARRDLLRGLLLRAGPDEVALLRGLVTGELRQGAQGGVLLEAIAVAAAAGPAQVRRALTLRGSITDVAVAALLGGPTALARIALEVGRPLAPMLAGSAPDLAAALAITGPAGVEWKLDGIRIQVHLADGLVKVFTRSLGDITDRVPEVVAAIDDLPVRSVVLDGEAIALYPDGRPRPFQQTAARTATSAAGRLDDVVARIPLTTYLFDVLHLDGADLTSWDAGRRRAELERLIGATHPSEPAAPPGLLVPRMLADPTDPASLTAAGRFGADALARGHEGVVVKALASPYVMGRRGAGWVKVKPVHSFDLVVLAAEWGHGRRTGWLSNLHLGARDPTGRYGPPGGFVMLGKTFKGLTDDLLRWQTDALRALATGPSERGMLPVRPELVIEIAVDGVQTSPRYPAGVALRFARVLRYRPDRVAREADTVDSVCNLLPTDPTISTRHPNPKAQP